MKYATIFLIILLGLLFIYLFNKYEESKKENKITKVFKGRDSLSTNDFYIKYYQGKNVPFDVVKGVKQVLEEQLDADLSKLSATDDFSKNLNFFWDYDSLADVEIVVALEDLFSIKINDSEAGKLKTVDDIILLVTHKIDDLGGSD